MQYTLDTSSSSQVTLVSNDIWVVFVHYYLRTVIFKLSVLFKAFSFWPPLNNKASWLYIM